MTYVPTVWVEKVTKLGPTNLNKLENGLATVANGGISTASDVVFAADTGGSGTGVITFKTNGGTVRAQITNAGTFQVGPALSLVSFSVGSIVDAGVTFSYTGVTGYESNFLAEGTVIGTSPAGPTAALVGFQAYIKDAATAVNKTVTGAVNNGSGLIRLTVTAHGLATGDRVGVYGVGGVTAANGAWAVTVVNANTLDLQGSTFSGVYTSGGTVTNRGAYYGLGANVAPTLDRGGLSGAAANGDDVVGLFVMNRGTGKATDGIYIGRNSANFPSTSEWLTGIAVVANADTAIYLAGAHSYGVDFNDGTYTSGVLRLPNNVAVVGRNAAGSADANLFRIGPTNRLTFESFVLLGEGIALEFGTTTGSMIGSATNQKLAFWGATPIVRPSGTPVAATDLASVISLANSLRTNLLALGLVA